MKYQKPGTCRVYVCWESENEVPETRNVSCIYVLGV